MFPLIRSSLVFGLVLLGVELRSIHAGRDDLAQDGPRLEIGRSSEVRAGDRVDLPIGFTPGDLGISSLAFSIDYDAAHLSFEGSDIDGDGLPDGLRVDLPPAFSYGATFDPSDEDGEIDVFVADLLPPLAALDARTVLTVTFEVDAAAANGDAEVRFSRTPAPSFGDIVGRSVMGAWRDGWVRVTGGSRLVYLPSLRLRLP